MRPMLIIGLCLAACACSPAEEAKVKNDARALGDKVESGVQKVGGEIKETVSDPELKADLKTLGDKTGHALKAGAAELKEGVQDATIMAGQKAEEQKARDRAAGSASGY